jgi:hypothetical protein
MAHYTIAYTCGHSDEVNLIGPARSRESRIAFLERGECFDCYKLHATEAARAQGKEMELPQLVGTESRVAWAETLRIAKLSEIEETVERMQNSKEYRQILRAVENIGKETSAKQWIEWRFVSPKQIIATVLATMMAAPTEEQKQQERAEQKRTAAIKRAVLVEATIRPETAVSETAAEIYLKDTVISVTFLERRDDFRELVRSMGYSYYGDSQWQRVIDAFAGSPADRAVELGHTLLANGFLVCIFDDLLRARIITGDFEPEQTRWITKLTKGDYAGWLAIQWGRHENYYDAAKKIRKSKYNRPNVVVPAVQFAQILDFAQMYDFKLSNGAQEALDAARTDKENMLVAVKKPVARRKKMQTVDTIPPVLVVPELVTIADDLQDDE